MMKKPQFIFRVKNEKVKHIIEKISYAKRREYEIQEEEKRIKHFLSIGEAEFSIDYKNAVAQYEHIRLFFGLPIFALFITAIWAIFKIFAQMQDLQTTEIYSSQEVEVMQRVVLTILCLTAVFLLTVLSMISRRIDKITKEKIFFDEMKKKRENLNTDEAKGSY